MLQRLIRGETADAIATATETLDAAIEDAKTEREALQAQYDALQAQISELWAEADDICRQMYELDEAIGGAASEIGGGVVTVQVYGRGGRSPARAEGDDEIRRQLEDLNERKGAVIRELEAMDAKYGVRDLEDFERKRDEFDEAYSRYEELDAENDALAEQMEELIDSAEGEISDSDYPNL